MWRFSSPLWTAFVPDNEHSGSLMFGSDPLFPFASSFSFVFLRRKRHNCCTLINVISSASGRKTETRLHKGFVGLSVLLLM